MTDFFLVLMLPGAGDELQGLKKGVVEIADMIAINKADGDNIIRARAAAAEYRAALHILEPSFAELVAAGGDLFGAERRRHCRTLGTVLDHRERMSKTGELAARRREQQVKWMWAMLEDRVFARLRSDPALKAKLPRIEAAVAAGRTSPAVAVDEIAAALGV